MTLSVFSCSWPFVYLWRNGYLSPLLIFKLNCLSFLLLSCECFLNILDTGPFTDTQFANISYILYIVFIFLVMSFDAQGFCFDIVQFIFFVVILSYTFLYSGLIDFLVPHYHTSKQQPKSSCVFSFLKEGFLSFSSF